MKICFEMKEILNSSFLGILSPYEHALVTLLEKFTDQLSLLLFTNTFLLILRNLKNSDI